MCSRMLPYLAFLLENTNPLKSVRSFVDPDISLTNTKWNLKDKVVFISRFQFKFTTIVKFLITTEKCHWLFFFLLKQRLSLAIKRNTRKLAIIIFCRLNVFSPKVNKTSCKVRYWNLLPSFIYSYYWAIDWMLHLFRKLRNFRTVGTSLIPPTNIDIGQKLWDERILGC